jgi:hypothetical protein
MRSARQCSGASGFDRIPILYSVSKCEYDSRLRRDKISRVSIFFFARILHMTKYDRVVYVEIPDNISEIIAEFWLRNRSDVFNFVKCRGPETGHVDPSRPCTTVCQSQIVHKKWDLDAHDLTFSWNRAKETRNKFQSKRQNNKRFHQTQESSSSSSISKTSLGTSVLLSRKRTVIEKDVGTDPTHPAQTSLAEILHSHRKRTTWDFLFGSLVSGFSQDHSSDTLCPEETRGDRR